MITGIALENPTAAVVLKGAVAPPPLAARIETSCGSNTLPNRNVVAPPPLAARIETFTSIHPLHLQGPLLRRLLWRRGLKLEGFISGRTILQSCAASSGGAD